MPRRRTRSLEVLLVAALVLLFALPALAAGGKSKGRELINSSGCRGCHEIGGKGGTLGPSLDGVGKRLSAAQIRRQLVNPKARHPSSMMPSYSYLPPKDLQALVDYLKGLK